MTPLTFFYLTDLTSLTIGIELGINFFFLAINFIVNILTFFGSLFDIYYKIQKH